MHRKGYLPVSNRWRSELPIMCCLHPFTLGHVLVGTTPVPIAGCGVLYQKNVHHSCNGDVQAQAGRQMQRPYTCCTASPDLHVLGTPAILGLRTQENHQRFPAVSSSVDQGFRELGTRTREKLMFLLPQHRPPGPHQTTTPRKSSSAICYVPTPQSPGLTSRQAGARPQ